MRQGHESRLPLFRRVEKEFGGRTLVTYFTSFTYPAPISDDDCEMLQSVLQAIDLSKGLVLMISSPGGDGLAAERIVNICRAYSGTGDYWALVPGRAKSAATIICMGASKIFMAPSSELGPVDPQIIRKEGDGYRVYSAHSLVQGYDKIFSDAVKTKGNLEPFIMQLQKYDHREIQNYKSSIALSESLAVKILSTGMCKGRSVADISKKIRMFIQPDAGTVVHGRPIYSQEAVECGLKVEPLDVNSPTWRPIYELYSRTNRYVSTYARKAVESRTEAYYQQPPRGS